MKLKSHTISQRKKEREMKAGIYCLENGGVCFLLQYNNLKKHEG